MKNRLQWFVKHKILSAILLIIIIIVASTSGSSKAPKSNTQASGSAATKTQQQAATNNQQPVKPTERQVAGKSATLGSGTFTGGTDVAVGLYDVTAGAGESGNFMVDGTDSYNEILGSGDLGVPKVRVQISNGDKIEISSLTQVTFTPVATPFVTTLTTTTIYAGTFIVGQDVAPGRYVATPGAGQSGNFIVSGNDSYNEILGGDSTYGGVSKVTVNLSKGDVIDISSLSEVTLTPQ